MTKVSDALSKTVQEIEKSTSQKKSIVEKVNDGITKIISYVPWLGTGTYMEPPINYGPKYGPYLPSPERGLGSSGKLKTKVNPLLPKL